MTERSETEHGIPRSSKKTALTSGPRGAPKWDFDDVQDDQAILEGFLRRQSDRPSGLVVVQVGIVIHLHNRGREVGVHGTRL
jgi:hypothetical protein